MSRNRQNTGPAEKWSSKGLELDPKHRDVKAEEVCVGSIVWLRQRRSNEDEITCVRPGHCSDDFKLLDNGYRHPVVILKIWQRRGSTKPGDLMLGASDLTTFKDTPFRKYINHRNLIKFEESIPILQPGEIASPNIEQLSLASGGLDRKSYVRLQHLLLVSVKCLWMYRWTEGSHAYDHRLDQQSYEKVMSELGVDPDIYESTEAVKNTGALRNVSLAREEAMELYENYRLQSEGSHNSGKGKDPDHNGSYGTGPSLANVNQHQERPDAVPDPHTPRAPVQEWLQTFDTKASFNPPPLEPLRQFQRKPSQMRIPYGIFPGYQDSSHVDNPTNNASGGVFNANISDYSSGHLPAYQQPPLQPLAGAYSTPAPAPAPTCFTPAVQNNFYFHGSTAHFDTPMNPIDHHGIQSNQMAQPAYRAVGHQFGRWREEGFNDQSFQQMAQQMGQQGPLLMGQDGYQQMPQRMGQEMAQQVPLYNQMTERYNPNLTAPQ